MCVPARASGCRRAPSVRPHPLDPRDPRRRARARLLLLVSLLSSSSSRSAPPLPEPDRLRARRPHPLHPLLPPFSRLKLRALVSDPLGRRRALTPDGRSFASAAAAFERPRRRPPRVPLAREHERLRARGRELRVRPRGARRGRRRDGRRLGLRRASTAVEASTASPPPTFRKDEPERLAEVRPKETRAVPPRSEKRRDLRSEQPTRRAPPGGRGRGADDGRDGRGGEGGADGGEGRALKNQKKSPPSGRRAGPGVRWGRRRESLARREGSLARGWRSARSRGLPASIAHRRVSAPRRRRRVFPRAHLPPPPRRTRAAPPRARRRSPRRRTAATRVAAARDRAPRRTFEATTRRTRRTRRTPPTPAMPTTTRPPRRRVRRLSRSTPTPPPPAPPAPPRPPRPHFPLPSSPLVRRVRLAASAEDAFVRVALLVSGAFVLAAACAGLALSGLLFAMGVRRRRTGLRRVDQLLPRQLDRRRRRADQFLLGMVCLVFGLGAFGLFLARSNREGGVGRAREAGWLTVAASTTSGRVAGSSSR